MKFVCLVLLVLGSFAVSAAVDFATFMFSTDGGKTWREEYPILTGTNRTFVLKAEWTGRDDRKMTWGGLMHCSLSSERDFATSEGTHWGSPLYWQEEDLKYKPHTAQYLPKTPQPYYFHVDLNARAEGAKSHPKTKKPLPACAGYDPGTWYFACHVGYHLEQPDPKTKTRLVEAVREFFVYIDDPKNSVVECGK